MTSGPRRAALGYVARRFGRIKRLRLGDWRELMRAAVHLYDELAGLR